jgi:hypothetical protein
MLFVENLIEDSGDLFLRYLSNNNLSGPAPNLTGMDLLQYV